MRSESLGKKHTVFDKITDTVCFYAVKWGILQIRVMNYNESL